MASADDTLDVAERICNVFRSFDEDGNGKITIGELKRVLQRLDPKTWDDESCNRLLNAVDRNRDGTLDFTEFVNFVCDDRKAAVDRALLVSDEVVQTRSEMTREEQRIRREREEAERRLRREREEAEAGIRPGARAAADMMRKEYPAFLLSVVPPEHDEAFIGALKACADVPVEVLPRYLDDYLPKEERKSIPPGDFTEMSYEELFGRFAKGGEYARWANLGRVTEGEWMQGVFVHTLTYKCGANNSGPRGQYRVGKGAWLVVFVSEPASEEEQAQKWKLLSWLINPSRGCMCDDSNHKTSWAGIAKVLFVARTRSAVPDSARPSFPEDARMDI